MYKRPKQNNGFTLVELMVTTLISLIVLSSVAIPLVNGHRLWNSSYKSAHKQIKIDAANAVKVFDATVRKAARNDYFLNIASGGPRTMKPAPGKTVKSNKQVTVRYWDYGRNAMARIFRPSVKPTHYAHFVHDKIAKELKVEFGELNPYSLNETRVLAQNVKECFFMHIVSPDKPNGHGCLKMKLTLVDPQDGQTITVKTGALMRN